MNEHSDLSNNWDELRAKIIGLGERSIRKSYYPELEQRLSELERFRALLDQSNDLIFLAQVPSGLFFDVNESACRLLGYTRETLLDMSISDIVPEERWVEMAGLFAKSDRAGREGKKFVTAFKCRQGDMPVEVSVRLVTFSEKYYAVIVAYDITERKKTEEKLRRFERAVEFSTDAIGMSTADGKHYYQNKAFDDLFGEIGEYPPSTPYVDEAVGQDVFDTIMSGTEWTGEVRMHGKSGKTLNIMLRAYSIKDRQGTVIGLVGVHTDITGQKKLEEQLRQSQKMESVGRLAGGVAHDFNNMLGIILGHADMILEEMAPDQPFYADLMEIRKAGERSADLTRQLLAFARKQTVSPKVIDLNKTVEGMLKMLHRLIGEDIDMAWIPGEKVWPVRIDPNQVDQILANLCVNARDAIADVGKVTIETGNMVFDEGYCKEHAGFVPGEYTLLAVSDNGCGMDDKTLENVFEPFFTTKELDQGTGLGLATVYGTVKQNNGFINVYSEPGQGTTFKIYLPCHAAKAAEAKEPRPQAAERGSETILLVEDEPAILEMTTMILERIGYKVLAAGTPGEAIAFAREHADRIHLLMTDVVMPEMNGRDLAKNLLSIYPDIKRLFMSGYTANVIAHHGVLDEGVHFIQKPFSIGDLAAKVREALEG